MGDLADGSDRVLEGHVTQHTRGILDHAQEDGHGAHLQVRGVLAHVGIADDDVQPPVVLGVGVGLVPGVDDGSAPGGRRGHAFPDVLGSLTDGEHRTARRLQHLACARVDLAADEERNEDLGVVRQIVAASRQIVLVTAVAVASRVGVVLEKVNRAADAFALSIHLVNCVYHQ